MGVFCRPERVPRLFDLVKASDKKFETAFYYALRDTLVVDDLNQATRIALQVGCHDTDWIDRQPRPLVEGAPPLIHIPTSTGQDSTPSGDPGRPAN